MELELLPVELVLELDRFWVLCKVIDWLFLVLMCGVGSGRVDRILGFERLLLLSYNFFELFNSVFWCTGLNTFLSEFNLHLPLLLINDLILHHRAEVSHILELIVAQEEIVDYKRRSVNLVDHRHHLVRIRLTQATLFAVDVQIACEFAALGSCDLEQLLGAFSR